jgi:hypothetical protein
MKFTMSIPLELIRKVRKAAARDGAERSRPMSVSEWMREAFLAKLDSAESD